MTSPITRLGDRMLGAVLPKARAAACAHPNGWCGAPVQESGWWYQRCQVGSQCIEYDHTPDETYTTVVGSCC